MEQDVRICFIGDSFVNGTGDETALGWAGRVCVSAHQQGIPVTYYNLGVRRNTSRDILLRWESEAAMRLPESCDGRVVISCGVNDTVMEDGATRVNVADACAHIRAILAAASKKYKVLMVSPPPVDGDEQNERIKHLSELFSQEARRVGIPYIDIFSILVRDEAYQQEVACNDGSHPNSTGYNKMARIVMSSTHWWFRE